MSIYNRRGCFPCLSLYLCNNIRFTHMYMEWTINIHGGCCAGSYNERARESKRHFREHALYTNIIKQFIPLHRYPPASHPVMDRMSNHSTNAKSLCECELDFWKFWKNRIWPINFPSLLRETVHHPSTLQLQLHTYSETDCAIALMYKYNRGKFLEILYFPKTERQRESEWKFASDSF